MTVLSRSTRVIGIAVALPDEDPPSGVCVSPRKGDSDALPKRGRQGVLVISGMVALGAPTLSIALYVEMDKRAKALGMTNTELSWTLEDNAPVNVGIKMMGGKVYKRYRVYCRDL